MTSRLPSPLPLPAAAWQAELRLRFARSGERTVLAENRHHGPLRVQKALYPEDAALCQAIVLHPPSGIAGGDALDLYFQVDAQAQAQLTTPGAGKWYRSGGAAARQHIRATVAAGAALEWLPQETIVFDGARASMASHIELAADSRFIGWETLCLGRTAAGERFREGHCALFTRVQRDGRLLWQERGAFAGDDALLHSPAGWAGATVSATLIAVAPVLKEEAAALLAAGRALAPADAARHALTYLPGPAGSSGVLLARYLGNSSEAAQRWLAAQWALLRPPCLGRAAVPPRIWNT